MWSFNNQKAAMLPYIHKQYFLLFVHEHDNVIISPLYTVVILSLPPLFVNVPLVFLSILYAPK